ncbi:indole-3-glycerol phosphate synthase TrpC [Bacillus tianshenii]|nr:indole-3-glycerol phosphate synthase TrpC [Bacillus tianshenii]
MLDQIHEVKKEELKHLKLPEAVELPRYSFYEALKEPNRPLALIAEVKKASPSKGLIREDFDPLTIAQAYQRAKADCISVLTDEQFFKGSRDYIKVVKEQAARPVLRKDFIIDELQIEESVRIGADAILLIAEMLGAEKLHYLYERATEAGLDCLVEVHEEKSLTDILQRFTPRIIGVNNRNLKTFETSLTQTEQIAKHVPNESIFISESGIHTPGDLKRVQQAGANGVLIGESFMRQQNVTEAVENLFAQIESEAIR